MSFFPVSYLIASGIHFWLIFELLIIQFYNCFKKMELSSLGFPLKILSLLQSRHTLLYTHLGRNAIQRAVKLVSVLCTSLMISKFCKQSGKANSSVSSLV